MSSRCFTAFHLSAFLFFVLNLAATAQPLTIGENTFFPIGSYELPGEEDALEEMVESGFNLFRCGNSADLDRVHALGAYGIMPLGFDQGATVDFKKKVDSVTDHPALAVWEGPDEIVWNFTAYSGLHRTLGIYPTRDEWKNQTDIAIEYSENQAAEIIPRMREAVEYIRSADSRSRPVWINEALQSDARFVRQCLEFIDITGCDIYPVKADRQPIADMGKAVQRWNRISQGGPVWMVLQAFSWHELGDYYGHTEARYPTFEESRFMAYDCLVHGADALLYWGSQFLGSEEFRRSYYDLAAELAALQPFLISPPQEVAITLLEMPLEPGELGVRGARYEAGGEVLYVLVNEDNREHLGVEVSTYEGSEGKSFEVLYSDEAREVREGSIILRLQPYEVKVLVSGGDWETGRTSHRSYGDKTIQD